MSDKHTIEAASLTDSSADVCRIAKVLEARDGRIAQLEVQREEDRYALKRRCLHDVVNLLLNSIQDTQPTDDPREVLRCLAVAVNETGIDDFGEGVCSCERPDCPYKSTAPTGSGA